MTTAELEAPGGNPGTAAADGRHAGTAGPAPSAQYRAISGQRLPGRVSHATGRGSLGSNPSKFVPENGYGPLERTDGLHARYRVRHRPGRIAEPAGRDQHLAEGRFGRATRTQPRRGTADVTLSQRSQSPRRWSTRRRSEARNGSLAYTTFLADGTLFYYLTIVPESDATGFQEAFRRIGQSIRLD